MKSHTQGSHPGYNPWKKNQQYLQIASGLSGEYTFVVALEDCQFTEPGHVIQVSVVVGDSASLVSRSSLTALFFFFANMTCEGRPGRLEERKLC